ncbi:MAG: DUF1549 domain-containing protein [Verrucomicrobiales bacterium]
MKKSPSCRQKKTALPAPLIADLGRWISQGAPYNAPLTDGQAAAHQPMRVTDQDRTFWAFRPLTITEAPPGQGEWKDSPIDRFILAALTAKAIQPNPPADPRTLARRASLDLTGLPPSPEALDRFLSAPTTPAWSDYVDHLLASPQYGERQARHWMDVARFAESSGFEHDYDRPTAYHYRDFLIKAFNEDLPWDRFTSWQIAGDELAPEEPLAQMATGFLAAGAFPTQLTEAEFERARYDELDDMAATTGAAFLGLSVGCARCHDHKYDPIPQPTITGSWPASPLRSGVKRTSLFIRTTTRKNWGLGRNVILNSKRGCAAMKPPQSIPVSRPGSNTRESWRLRTEADGACWNRSR